MHKTKDRNTEKGASSIQKATRLYLGHFMGAAPISN